jgi:hypothetical protein
MSRELGTALTGRHVTFRAHPLAFGASCTRKLDPAWPGYEPDLFRTHGSRHFTSGMTSN